MTDRTGQVWLGVLLEDEADVCLCVQTTAVRNGDTVIGSRHRFIDLETGEAFVKREIYSGTQDEMYGFDDQPGRRRLV